MLSLSFITGTEPDKWFRRFTNRTDHGGLRTVASDDALAQLLSGDVDVALVRLPDARVTDEMHVVRLYDEQPGIALPVDHTLTLLEQVGETDIVGELIHYQGSSDIPAIREHLGVVAAGVGVVIAPRPVLKLLSGKKIAHREYHNPTYPCPGVAENRRQRSHPRLRGHRQGPHPTINPRQPTCQCKTRGSTRPEIGKNHNQKPGEKTRGSKTWSTPRRPPPVTITRRNLSAGRQLVEATTCPDPCSPWPTRQDAYLIPPRSASHHQQTPGR